MTSQGTVSRRAVIYLRVSTLEQTQTATDDRGFSIHGQEQACRAKADAIAADIVDVYTERAESAKSLNRPQLQAMLRRIRDQRDVDVVIVYKVDRFARNRIEDGQMLIELKGHGVELVSATENIDDTPAGRLMHGVLASIAEYEVATLGSRASMGMYQKAVMGGTPGRAPIGYLNVRKKLPDGREIRTVDVDPDRAPHIQWLFRSYAAGEYSIPDLASELGERGLRTIPHQRKSSPKSVSKSQVGKILRDPYYVGKVRYKDEIFDGNHEAIISQELFDRVQDILTSRHVSGTRRRIHDHHLKGSLRCRQCRSRIYLNLATNRHGTTYPYFFCSGRREKDCSLPYVKVEEIEDQVDHAYRTAPELQLTEQQVTKLRSYLRQELDLRHAENTAAIEQATKRLDRLRAERKKLLDLYYDEDITRELFRDEQHRLDGEERQARQQRREAEVNLGDVVQTIEQALHIVRTWPTTFTKASHLHRRRFNQVFFQTIWLEANETATLQPAEHLTALTEAARELDSTGWQPGDELLPATVNSTHPDTTEPGFSEPGSCKSYLVPPVGIEPTHTVPETLGHS